MGAEIGIHHLRHDRIDQFSGNGDEASHFVTGLMIRDYLVQDFGHNPVPFAKAYYLHYPKVAFGSWPPLMHLGLALWMLVFPPIRESAALYTDLLTAVLAISAAMFARRSLPLVLAGAVGAAVWLSPLIQELDQEFLADLQYGLIAMACIYLFASYVDDSRPMHAAWFGLALLGAVMTKNNALFLAISVPLVILLTRSFQLLRRWDFWLSLVPAVLFVGVWQYLTLPFNTYNMAGRNAETAVSKLFAANFVDLAKIAWIGLLPFILWGVYRVVVVPLMDSGRVRSCDAASFALMLGAPLFHSLLPHGAHERYLTPCLAPLLIFAIEGGRDLLARLRFMPNSARLAAAAALVVLPAAAQPVGLRFDSNFGTAAAQIINRFPAEQSVLISGYFGAESALIAELAVRDRRPGLYALRATKILRHKVRKYNRDTEVVATSKQEMIEYFRDLPVGLVVLMDDGDAETKTSRDYLAEMIHEKPDLFQLVSSMPMGHPLWSTCRSSDPCTIGIYKFTGEPANTRFDPGKLPNNMPLWTGL